jgi:hypothetical protein
MQQKNTTRRARLPRDVYSTVERVTEIITNADAFPAAEDLLSDILLELSNNTQVWTDHPELVRPFLMVCARLENEEVQTRFSELRQACHFAGSAAAIKDLRARLKYYDDEEEEIDEAPAGTDETPADENVVSLSLWVQSHPQPSLRREAVTNRPGLAPIPQRSDASPATPTNHR